MKPFDLDAAKRGEPIQVLYRDQWIDAYFVGVSKTGHIVAEGDYASGQFSTWGGDNVRMAPRKRTVYVNLWKGELRPGNVYVTEGKFPPDAHAAHWFDTEEQARSAATCGLSKGVSPHCLAVAVPVAIEE
ncbi:MAG TPA: hypothetical protein VF534_01695 [Paraburkholderia sp.]